MLTAPPYILAVIISLATSYWSDRVQHRTTFIFFHSLIAITGLALVATPVPLAVKVLGVFLAVAGANPNQPAALAFAQNNIVSTSKRSVVTAVQIAFGAVGGIVASTVYSQDNAPEYFVGLMITIGFECLAVGIAVVMAFWFHRRNGEADKDDIELEGHYGFRYTT